MLPKLVRVVKDNASESEQSWADAEMSGDDIVKLAIANDGTVEAVLINMSTFEKYNNKKIIFVSTFLD